MKFKRLTAFAILLLTTQLAGAQHRWTLDECIKYAIEHNISIQQGMVNIDVQGIVLEEARKSRLPSFDLMLGEQVSFGNYNLSTGVVNNDDIEGKPDSDRRDDLSYTSARLAMTMPLFNGMALQNNIKANEALLQAATANLENARKDIGIQISTFYLECLYYQSLADVAEAQVGVSKKLLERATLLVSQGRRPRSEQAEAESQLANDEYMLADAKGQAVLARVTLGHLLNLPEVDDFVLAGLDEPFYDLSLLDPNLIYNNVVEDYPSVRAAKSRIDAGKYQLKVAHASYYPQIALQGYISTFYVKLFQRELNVTKSSLNYFRDLMNEVIGIQINVPIYHHREARNKVRRANLSVRNMELMLDDARQTLRKEIQTAYYNAEVSRNKLEAADKAVTSSLITVGYEEESYSAGRSNIFDLQSAQQKSLQAQQNAVRAKYEYLIRQRILDFYCK